MTQEMQFKKIIAQYCDVKPEEMTNDMKFREDLGFSSLDFMSFLGEIEDTFDIELEEDEFYGCFEGLTTKFQKQRFSCILTIVSKFDFVFTLFHPSMI